jgi:tRNA A-37 threonylcarbamoyl transferase component Bud32
MPEEARRISRIKINGEALWLKDFDQTSRPKWHAVQQAVFVVTRLQVLRPVPSRAGNAGCEHEIEAMRLFREAGARVPDVRWRREAAIAITDIGETLRAIEGRVGGAGIAVPAMAAARELGRIHGQGLAHGRPILRNLTWDGATVGFLDFEEQPMSVMPRDTAQARDILLLLMSLGRRNQQQLVSAAFGGYAAEMSAGVELELRRLARATRLLTGGLAPYLLRVGTRDVKGLLVALSVLRVGR